MALEHPFLDGKCFVGDIDINGFLIFMRVLYLHENTFDAAPLCDHFDVLCWASTLPEGNLGTTRYYEKGPPEGERREEYPVTSIA